MRNVQVVCTVGLVNTSIGLRERKKDATRRALAETALALAIARGYEAFTIADLADAVGVSRRTFSNYFADRAECLAAVTEGWLDDVLDAIRDAPESASLSQALRAGLLQVARGVDDRWAVLMPIMERHPDVQARVLALDSALTESVAEAVADRTGLPVDDIRVTLLAAFGVTAGRTCIAHWLADGKLGGTAALSALLESGFSIIDLDGLGPPADGDTG